jgi:hypothetical protein
MTLTEILEHESIRSDRYALAAISHIYKAFGDPIRSKECWPWGRDVQFEWYPSQGTDKDITEAELLLERARTKFEEEISSDNEYTKLNDNIGSMDDLTKQAKLLRNKLMKINRHINKINKSNENIIKVSEEIESKIEE